MILSYISVLFMVICTGYSKPTDTTSCSQPADVVFILDTSSSIWEPDYKRQLKFVKDVVDTFNIGPAEDQVRVGLVTFSTDIHPQFNLNTYFDINDLKNAIINVPYATGNTNTAAALEYAVGTMLQESAGSRDDVVRVIIVITDGLSQNVTATKLASQNAKLKGIHTFAIGVGHNVDEKELKTIGSSPHETYVFTVNSYAALNSIKGSLSGNTCEVTRSVAISTTPAVITEHRVEITTESTLQDQDTSEIRKSCGGKPADVFFLIDSSSSILIDDFKTQLSFVNDVVDIFDVACNKTRVAVSAFSERYTPVIDFNEFGSKIELAKAISDVPYLGGGTNTGAAIQEMRAIFQSKMARPEVAHVGIIITDGQSNDPEVTATQAALAHNAGIYLFAIGIGQEADAEELSGIASNPDEEFMFTVDRFDALGTLRDILAIRACGVGTRTTLTPETETKLPSDQAGRCTHNDEVEVMFVIDTERMIARKTVEISHFIAGTVDRLDTESGNIKVGLLSHECSALNYPLSDDLTGIKEELRGVKVHGLDVLIKNLRRNSFRTVNNAGKNARKMAVLFVDQPISKLKNVLIEAKRAKFQNIDIFVVAIGPRVNKEEVRSLASSPGHVLSVANLNDLRLHEFVLADIIC